MNVRVQQQFWETSARLSLSSKALLLSLSLAAALSLFNLITSFTSLRLISLFVSSFVSSNCTFVSTFLLRLAERSTRYFIVPGTSFCSVIVLKMRVIFGEVEFWSLGLGLVSPLPLPIRLEGDVAVDS